MNRLKLLVLFIFTLSPAFIIAQGGIIPPGKSGNSGKVKVVPGEKEYKTAHKFYQNHDYEGAVTWLKKSSELNHAAAMCDLALMYQYGIGIDADLEKANYYYRCAAGRPGGFSSQKQMVKTVLDIYHESGETDESLLSFFSCWRKNWYGLPVIHFYMDQTDVRREHKLLLDFIVHIIKSNPDMNDPLSSIIVTGYQNGYTGTADSNNELKAMRVVNVKKYLVSKGIDENSFNFRLSGENLTDYGPMGARLDNVVTIELNIVSKLLGKSKIILESQ